MLRTVHELPPPADKALAPSRLSKRAPCSAIAPPVLLMSELDGRVRAPPAISVTSPLERIPLVTVWSCVMLPRVRAPAVLSLRLPTFTEAITGTLLLASRAVKLPPPSSDSCPGTESTPSMVMPPPLLELKVAELVVVTEPVIWPVPLLLNSTGVSP